MRRKKIVFEHLIPGKEANTPANHLSSFHFYLPNHLNGDGQQLNEHFFYINQLSTYKLFFVRLL